MDLVKLKQKLVAAARCHPPGDKVPYAFEKRIMARLGARPQTDEWAWWSRALWRSAAACAAFALLLSVWSLLPLSNGSSANGAVDLEEAVLASVDEADGTW